MQCKQFINYSVICTVLGILSACAMSPKLTESNWYVRSEFTWWEARPEFMFSANAENTAYTAEFPLIPDGRAFTIKVADKQWSQNRNCGLPEQANDNVLLLGQWHMLDCNYRGQKVTPLEAGYQFTPQEAGQYMIMVTFKEGRPNQMKLTRL